MKCTKCGSSSCRTLEMINDSGSSAGTVDNSVESKSQTALAARCNPPSNGFRTLGWWLSWAIGLLALPTGCMSSISNGTHFPANVGVGIAAMLITAVVLMIGVQVLSNTLGFTRKYQERLKEWKNSFMCLDCGHVMLNDDE